MDHSSIRKTYKIFSPLYDFVFAPFFKPGQRDIVERMRLQEGEDIIEIGVGTGTSLPWYPERVNVVGIDLSPEMLQQAQERVEKENMQHVQLYEMDAENLRYEDNMFDAAALMHVVSVAANPDKLMAETRRVCKPGADVFIVNHFSHSSRVIGSMEKLLTPFSKLLGFRPDFPLDGFLEKTELEIRDVTPVNLFGYWTLIHGINRK